jgi:hypothetical protein
MQFRVRRLRIAERGQNESVRGGQLASCYCFALRSGPLVEAWERNLPMNATRLKRLLLNSVTIAAVGLSLPAWGQGFPNGIGDALGPFHRLAPDAGRGAPRHGDDGSASAVSHWNGIAIDASGLDHTPVAAGEVRVFGEQFGPTRASRAMAIVHIAIFEAVNAIARRYHSYAGVAPVREDTSMDVAVAQAAHDTLAALYPSQRASFDQQLSVGLHKVHDARARSAGIALGQRAAAAILALRSDDGSAQPEPRLGVDFITGVDPGDWRQDPISRSPIALGAHWSAVRPFVLRSSDQMRVVAPPALGTAQYASAFAEVKALGGDGIATPTVRTPEQTQIGIFWAYDGTPSLCAPPRLYNQIAMQVAQRMRTDIVALARLLALVNTAMADAGIAIWESKYHYEFWRPVTAIREANQDGNAATAGDPTFTPLGAPASNLTGPNFTPPFPAYPSGHAGFGGALFETLRNFYQRDHVPFTFVSDEFNGVTLDHDGNVRPYIPRHFSSFSEAEEENGQSRIYLGIHWSFDKTEGIAQGQRVARYVFGHAFLPRE